MRVYQYFIHLTVLFWLISCAGGASPAPFPVEMPAAPGDVGIDVQTTMPAVGERMTFKALISPSGELFDAMTYAAIDFTSALSEFDKISAPLRDIIIPVGTDITSYTAIRDVVTYHFDFSDFDYDGDGVTEECSGSTGALPICMRVVREDESGGLTRYAQAVYEDFPSETAGRGQFRGAHEGVL